MLFLRSLITESVVEKKAEKKDVKSASNIHLFKSKNLPKLDDATLKLLIKFINFASKKLEIEGKPFEIHLLSAAPKEHITTGAYEPSTKKIRAIVQGRHFIDYCRTISHEMTHQKQDYEGRTEGPTQDIGGPIEDEANAVAGQIVKAFIKNELTKEERQHLGLGLYP